MFVSASKFVSRLCEEDVKQIIFDYEHFTKNGYIGKSALRTYAEEFMEEIGAQQNGVVRWMEIIAFEAYRRIALECIKKYDN